MCSISFVFSLLIYGVLGEFFMLLAMEEPVWTASADEPHSWPPLGYGGSHAQLLASVIVVEANLGSKAAWSAA